VGEVRVDEDRDAVDPLAYQMSRGVLEVPSHPSIAPIEL